MTESIRPGGEPQYPHDPQLPLYFGPQGQRPGPGPAHREPGGPWHEGTSAGFPPPAQGTPPARRRGRRAGRGVTLLAAVALAAGLIGGGAGALVGNATQDTASAPAVTRAVNASALDGTVSGVAKAVGPSIVEVNAASGAGRSTGAGIILTADGEIVTNNHVVAGADTVSVTYSNGRKATATVVGTDPRKDLALIRVQGAAGLPAATLGDSSGVMVGDQVVAIGSPEGLTGTVTSGIVSALDRDVTVSTDENPGGRGGDGQWPFSFGGNQFNGDTGTSTTTYKAIQTDASLNPGNSGGALINMSGQIIGINSAMYSDASANGSSAGSVGLGFAIPVDTVKADLATLRAGGTH